MPLLRTGLTALSASICSFVLIHAVSCGTDAVGVDDCRDIETARCEAAASCQGDLHVEDVDACKRYYRDHCLHGLRVEDEPGAPVLNACVRAIEAAGACAAVDPNTTVADCAADEAALRSQTSPALVQVCDIIQYPERTIECEFLLEAELPPEEPPPGTAGQPGTAGAGAGGAGG